MSSRNPRGSCLGLEDEFTCEQLAVHLIDTLAFHDFIDKSRIAEAVASVKWELVRKRKLGAILLEPKGEEK